LQVRAADGGGGGGLAEAGARGEHPPEPAQNLTGTAKKDTASTRLAMLRSSAAEQEQK